MSVTAAVDFSGIGGDSLGLSVVPGLVLVRASNHEHWRVEVHTANFPDADHLCEDIIRRNVMDLRAVDFYWASPACPSWTDARGKRRDFDHRNRQGVLFETALGPVDPKAARSRALMEEVPRYLEAMVLKGRPVLAGVVENVIQCRLWSDWRRWVNEIEALGYKTRLIALNSMHAQPLRSARAPQSRDRLYLAYWSTRLGRDPDWNRWLRPKAYCPTCDETVAALQVFKDPRHDMGRYGRHGQYYYRCPRTSCRNRIIEPDVLPASTAIDWSLPPGQPIGERVDKHGHPDPLRPRTLARVQAGWERFARPMLVPCGGTWRDTASPLDARTTRDTDALVLPPLVIPYYGNGTARAASAPMATVPTRDRFALLTQQGGRTTSFLDCAYRMFVPREHKASMAIPPDYKVKGTHKQEMRGYGDAVTPPVAEVLGCAEVEAITGEEIAA